MIYAQINNNIVINVVELDNIANLSNIQKDQNGNPFQYVIEIEDLSPMPGIGWVYNGTVFSPSSVPDDAYGNVVTFSTDTIIDTYTSNGIAYPFPAGTPQAQVYLSIAMSENLNLFQSAVQAFVDSHYSLEVRFNFNAIYILAVQNGLTNRAAYITQLFTWAQNVVTYCTNYVTEVKALTDPNVISETEWDFSQISADPLVTTAAAILISD